MEDQSPQRRRIRTGVAIMAATALGLVVAVPSSASAGEAHLQPREVEGDPTCADVQPDGADWTEFEIDSPSDGEHSDGLLRVQLALSEGPDGQLLEWSSINFGVDAVIVKGGDKANVYEYDREAIEDSGLHAPFDPQDQQFFDIERVSFCYDVQITVDTFDRPPPPEPESEVAPVVEAQPTFTG